MFFLLACYRKRQTDGCISDMEATDDEGPPFPVSHTPSSGLIRLPEASPAEYFIAKEQR